MKQTHRNTFIFAVLFAMTVALWNSFLSSFALSIWIKTALSILFGVCIGLLLVKIKGPKS